MENIIRLAKEGADYAGYGPFAETETKPNNYALLGTEGYQQIIKELKVQSISIPVLAVGGIKTYDVEALMQTGIYGIAVSGAINFADDFIEAYQDFYTLVKESAVN